jgi:hypothetical protein
MAGLSPFPYRGSSSSREWACASGFCRFPDFGLYRSGTADRRVTPPFPLDYFLRHPGQRIDQNLYSRMVFPIEHVSWRQVDTRIASAGSGSPPRPPGLEGDSVDSRPALAQTTRTTPHRSIVSRYKKRQRLSSQTPPPRGWFAETYFPV